MIPFPNKKYATIYADPPWIESGGGKIKRGADRHYNLMKTKDIMALPVQDICEENAHLYLWVTNNFLQAGLDVMKAWGFTYKTKITWVKAEEISPKCFKLEKPGLGQYFRGLDEVCLFGVKGMIPYKTDESGHRLQSKTVVIAPRGRHSEKPEEMRRQIEIVSPGPYIELFARKSTLGWDIWGDQAPEINDLEYSAFNTEIKDNIINTNKIEEYNLWN